MTVTSITAYNQGMKMPDVDIPYSVVHFPWEIVMKAEELIKYILRT